MNTSVFIRGYRRVEINGWENKIHIASTKRLLVPIGYYNRSCSIAYVHGKVMIRISKMFYNFLRFLHNIHIEN